MRIKSNFKDYYDYLSRYDSEGKLIYNRNTIDLTNVETFFHYYRIKNFVNANNSDFFKIGVINRELKINQIFQLIFCGKRYLLIDYLNGHKEVYQGDQPIFVKSTKGIDSFTSINKESNFFVGTQHECYDNLSKLVNHPVFLILTSGSYNIKTGGSYFINSILVDQNIPNLAKLGFGNLLSPENAYQEIEHYLTNVLRDNPDIKPPVSIGNNDLIISKGFDIKSSFRKPKQVK